MTAFFEDVAVGDVAVLGQYEFTPDEIKRFARRYDPQVFHLDEAAAAASHFGALCASGWHTAAVWMKLMIAHQERQAAEARVAGQQVAALGPSPGFRDLKWLKPVYAGDVLTYESRITGKRVSGSRPGWGLVTQENSAVNQKGERVFAFSATVFWPLSPSGA
jgi:acyl dehydratase